MKLKNVLLSCITAAACVFGLTGCSGTTPGNISKEMSFADGDTIAEINIENYGTITVKLFPDIAPNAVKNFIQLAEKGYYDGLKIHRVAKDMCIQGGSLYGDGTGGSAAIGNTGSFSVEISENARNFYGALGCAASEEGENTTQFYIVNKKTPEDITKYSDELILNDAAALGEKIETLEEGDPLAAQLKYKQTSLTNLADMIGKASDKVKARYAEDGGYPLWDGAYTIFGQVYEGFEVLDKLSQVEVITAGDGTLTEPKVDIIIESVKIMEYKTPEPAES